MTKSADENILPLYGILLQLLVCVIAGFFTVSVFMTARKKHG